MNNGIASPPWPGVGLSNAHEPARSEYPDNHRHSLRGHREWFRVGLACLVFTFPGALGLMQAQTNYAVLANDGAWTWFNDPRALLSNGLLYFSYNRFSDGRVVLSAFNPQTGGTSNLWTSSLTEQDDHDVAGLLRKQDGTMLAVYARHGDDQFFTYRLSNGTNPASASAWGGEQRASTGTNVATGLSYSNPFQLAGEGGRIYNFARYLNYNPTVFNSTDGGATWSPPQTLIQTGANDSIRPYVKYCSDYWQRLDFLYTDGHPDSLPTSLYHLYYQGGAFYQTDGTFLKTYGALPILHDAGERGSVIYQYSTGAQSDPNQWIPGARAWCWEIAYQTNGAPFCVFQTKVDNVTGTNWYDSRICYYYARWTGTNWQKRLIAQAGRPLYDAQPDYGGGVCLDPQDPATVYVATDAANPFDLSTTTKVPLGNHYEIWKGATTNGGLSFNWQAMTTNSTVDNLRPCIPRRFGGEPCVLWFRGTYTSYTSFSASIVGLFTTQPAPIPPTIAQNPSSITNAYVGENDAFAVQANGTPPLAYQWFCNRNPISTVANPSAATGSLSLTNVQLTDTGYYYVTVSNGVGAATSAVVQLMVHGYPAPSTNLNRTILRLQFVAAVAYVTPPADFQSGWQIMSLNSGPTLFNGATKVTVSPLGGATLMDRDRAVQGGYPLVTNHPPAMTTANLYNSFIFDYTPNVGTGLDVLIQNLTPNTVYGVNLWSFASSSPGRVSDWTEAISGRTIAHQYSSPGGLPTADYDATIGGLLISDANGQLDLQGVFDVISPAGSVDVFLNALELTANPLPCLLGAVVATDGNLSITAQAQYSGQTIVFQESPDLVNWHTASDGVNASQHGPIFRSEFPLNTNRQFYRVRIGP